MHGKTYIIVTETDIQEWVGRWYGISIKFGFDVMKDTPELMLRAEIDPKATTFERIKKITKGGEL